MEPKVKFKFDIRKDAWNYVDCVSCRYNFGYDFAKYIDKKIVNTIKRYKWNSAKKYVIRVLEKNYSKNREKINRKIGRLEQNWRRIEQSYFNRLARLTKRRIYTGKFTGYITTIQRCPYDPKNNWFMISIFMKNALNVSIIAHELMHLQFHHYFEKKLRRKLSFQQFQDLKEALTVLLNLEFKDILSVRDKGYPMHEDLRKFIIKTWKQEKDFNKLVEKSAQYVKQKRL